jgi:hypothetical protein
MQKLTNRIAAIHTQKLSLPCNESQAHAADPAHLEIRIWKSERFRNWTL